MVMSSAYAVSFTGACGVGMSDVKMVMKEGDRKLPCGPTFKLTWRLSVVSVCNVCIAFVEVVCDESENSVYRMFVGCIICGSMC